jgi:hypothetical protein
LSTASLYKKNNKKHRNEEIGIFIHRTYAISVLTQVLLNNGTNDESLQADALYNIISISGIVGGAAVINPLVY